MARHKNSPWVLPLTEADGLKWEHASISVLMDIRDELQTLTRILGCVNFLNIPTVLKAIQKNTTKKRKKA